MATAQQQPLSSSKPTTTTTNNVIEKFGSVGMFVWTEDNISNHTTFSSSSSYSSSQSFPQNYLFLSVPLLPDTYTYDYADFVFPIILGMPANTPLPSSSIERIMTQYKPGCYLVAAQDTEMVPPNEWTPIVVYRSNVTLSLERLRARLHFVMFCANQLDRNFFHSSPVHKIEDLEEVKGLFYPNKLCNISGGNSGSSDSGGGRCGKDENCEMTSIVVQRSRMNLNRRGSRNSRGNRDNNSSPSSSQNSSTSSSPSVPSNTLSLTDAITAAASSSSTTATQDCASRIVMESFGGGTGLSIITNTTTTTTAPSTTPPPPTTIAEDEAQLKLRTGTKRIMKRYSDLVELYSRNRNSFGSGGVKSNQHHHNHHCHCHHHSLHRQSFVTRKPESDADYYSERFNFFLAQEAYTIIVDQNSQATGVDQPKPHYRLLRPGSYVAIEGMPRYANLTLTSTTYLTRLHFLSRLTTYPLLIVQEGIKAFDIYYTLDGLDCTYIDVLPQQDLLLIDWYQVQMDFKLDPLGRLYKGHVMRWDELSDVLITFRDSGCGGGGENVIELDTSSPNDLRYQPLVLTLEEVAYNYHNNWSGQMDVIWNLYAKIDPDHLQSDNNNNNVVVEQMFLYLKSYYCSYRWNAPAAAATAQTKGVPQPQLQPQQSQQPQPRESSSITVTCSDLHPTTVDLAKVGWTKQKFDQFLSLYLTKQYPQQESLKRWLVQECRRLCGPDSSVHFVRPTTLADRLCYRNTFFNARLGGGNSGGGGATINDTTTIQPQPQQPSTKIMIRPSVATGEIVVEGGGIRKPHQPKQVLTMEPKQQQYPQQQQ